MTRWMRILCAVLCLCVLCGIAVVGASAAAALPIKFSTEGKVYKYAIKGTDPDTVTYGASSPADAAGSGSAALSGRSISVGLDTGDSKNFKLCYKEIPVTVTVPARTTYTVTFDFALKGSYTRNRKGSAKASFQVVYLGDASAADKTTVFYPYNKSGSTIKTTIGGSDANTNIVQITMDDATTVNRSETKSYDFVNNTSQAKDITKYFGVWTAANFGSRYSNQAKATCTVTLASYLVTFDPNGGRVSPTSTAVTIGKKYGPLPTPNRTGYSFAGWYTEKTGGTKVTETTTVGNDPPTKLYAHWTAKNYLVTLHANGGKLYTPSGLVNTRSYTVTYGSKYPALPDPTRTGGYTFDGWYTDQTNGTKVTSATTVTTTKDHILYAHWHLTPAGAPYNVKLTMTETGVYGERIYHRVSASLYPDHTQKRTWYECDKNGDNGILLTDENGDPTYPTTPTAGVHYYYVVVTATRKDNGLQASTKSNVVCVTVTKATPKITEPPTAADLDLAVGDTLAASALTGGTAKNNNARPSINVAGRFVWKDATVTVKPPLGTRDYAVVFYPDDTANYEPTETTVRVQVTCSHKFGAWSAGKRTCTACGKVETRYNTVTITWGELAYTYTDGAWNPATHEYDIGGGWAPNQTNGDIITVRNDSADKVRVSFQYTKTNAAIGGSFANSEGHGIYSPIELKINRTQTVRLCLTGRPDKALNNAKIGSVTVRLERGY
ncbi:InlB B-repeat-containing protein [Gemmiger formicilis]